MAEKIIFSSGLPRSCSTLMCNILANNPKIGGGETSPLLEYVYGARSNFSSTPEVKSALTEKIMKDSFLSFCREGMIGYANKATDKPIFLDKSRGWIHYYPFLNEFYDGAKVIVMVRDIRSIISSFEKKWRQNPSIIDQRDIPSQQSFITVDQRVNHWLNEPPLGIALKRLYNAVQSGTIDNMLVVRAEDLTKNPKQVMQKVYKFIEEPYFEMDYSKVKQVTVENDRISDFGIYGDHKIKPEIKPLEKDYNEVLTPEISQQIKNAYSWFYNKFGYF